MTVGTYLSGGYKVVEALKVGQNLPGINSGIQSSNYRITSSSATGGSGISATNWTLDKKRSKRTSSSVKLVFTRDKN